MSSDTLAVLALGDSYTIGESVAVEERWPFQLVEALREAGLAVEAPLIVARTGWTTDELKAGIEEAGVGGPYDLVTLLIGVNNQYRGRELEEFRLQFSDLLGQAISFAAGNPNRVLVLSIPDWGVTPFAEGRDRDRISREIDAFNGVKRLEAEGAGARYVDVTGISREAAGDFTLVAEDGLHPSGIQYARWTAAALPVALEMLRGGRRDPARP
jgi:lysophospholipase L1-like esterase